MKNLIFIILFCISLTFAVKPIDGLQVSGNYLVNSQNQLVILRGTTRAGTEYACVQGNGIFDGVHDVPLLQKMASWGINAVRIPMNEQCWLELNGINSAFSGTNYKNAIIDWVDMIYSQNMAVILDLHWTASGTNWASGQQPMPNQDHSLDFWTSVANTFKNRSYVIFEAFNEPFPDNNQDTTLAWQCWRDGGQCNSLGWNAAGMQSIVTAIRNTGATNVIALGGVQYSNCLTRWLAYKPTDPLNNLVAVWHTYNFNLCNNINCWNANIKTTSSVVPLIATEIGEDDCAHGYIDGVMNFLDSINQNYLAWTFNPWNCAHGPALIDTSGNPTNYGIGYKDHITGQTNSFPPVPSFVPPTQGPTGAPPVTQMPSPGNTVYYITWATNQINDYWLQMSISPKPSGTVYLDCGQSDPAGKQQTTVPTWSSQGQDYILNTNQKCNANRNVKVWVDNYLLISKSDASGINFIAPNTVSYTLTWNTTANNQYWTQVQISPAPVVPVYFDCGYFVYSTTIPTWATNNDVFILSDTNIACSTTVTVYIGTANVVSKSDGTGTNVIVASTITPTTPSTSSPSTTGGSTTVPTTPSTTTPSTTTPSTTTPSTTTPTTSGGSTTVPTTPSTTTPSTTTTGGSTTTPSTTTTGGSTTTPSTTSPSTTGGTTTNPSTTTTGGSTSTPSTTAPTSTPTPTTKNINACLYPNTNCSGNSTSCLFVTFSTVNCNSADPIFQNTNLTFALSSRFSFSGNNGNYTYFSGASCTGSATSVSFQLNSCFGLPGDRSMVFGNSSAALSLSLFILLVLFILNLLF